MKDIETTTLCFENEVGGYCPGLIFLLTTTMTSINIDCSLFPAGGHGNFKSDEGNSSLGGAVDRLPASSRTSSSVQGLTTVVTPYTSYSDLWCTRLHAGLRAAYKCRFCPYKTTFKGGIVLHEQRHSEAASFKCRFCNYMSLDGTNVAKHEMSKHTGKKPYKCSLCAYIARTKCHLTEHLRTHQK
ncbi:zinc finger protein 64-like isoform X2 [Ornithodoros turicata]|uniref:zinc finger protein 64-like isoform X2 n=1 Tax=Ornithodoros turicata TaxID=34597 RepID=UPI00313949C5